MTALDRIRERDWQRSDYEPPPLTTREARALLAVAEAAQNVRIPRYAAEWSDRERWRRLNDALARLEQDDDQ